MLVDGVGCYHVFIMWVGINPLLPLAISSLILMCLGGRSFAGLGSTILCYVSIACQNYQTLNKFGELFGALCQIRIFSFSFSRLQRGMGLLQSFECVWVCCCFCFVAWVWPTFLLVGVWFLLHL